jgi:hypothetical protein
MRAILFLIFIFFITPAVNAQSANLLLRQADELFDQKRYTEAYPLYLQIFNEHQQASPEMLVKMAYITEGLDEHGLALYYLNLYYYQTAEKAALKKMESLAKEHNLKGYEFGDFELFVNFYHRHYTHIVYLFLAFSLLFFALLFRSAKKSATKPIGLAIAYMVTLAVLFVLINFDTFNSKGIVTNEAYIMEAPSAAANLKGFAQKGNKVTILNEDDVWLKIKWDDQNAYIRRNNIIKLN